MDRPKKLSFNGDLSARQKRFAEVYVSNGLDSKNAAKQCGYKESYGPRLVHTPEVKAYILELNRHIDEQAAETVALQRSYRIATKAELQEFWTTVVFDDSLHMKERLKSSELLGKSLGLFIDRQFISGANGEDISIKVTFE